MKIYCINKQYKITTNNSFPVPFSHLWLETHFSPPVLLPLLGGNLLPQLETKLNRLYCAILLKIKRGDSDESSLKKTLYTLSQRKNENLKVFPSRYCGCATASVKFRGLCHVCIFNCLFVFVVSAVETSFEAIPYQNA